MIIREYRDEDEPSIIKLWQACNLVVSWNDPRKDIQRKLSINPELFLVGELNDVIVASVMGGYEGHRGWINYLAVHPDYQRKGYGKRIMEEVESRIKAKGCPKINLQVRSTNKPVIQFYEHIGYKEDLVLSMGKRLIDDDAHPDSHS